MNNLSNLTADPGAITEKLVKVAINKTSEVREIISLSNQSHKILAIARTKAYVFCSPKAREHPHYANTSPNE